MSLQDQETASPQKFGAFVDNSVTNFTSTTGNGFGVTLHMPYLPNLTLKTRDHSSKIKVKMSFL